MEALWHFRPQEGSTYTQTSQHVLQQRTSLPLPWPSPSTLVPLRCRVWTRNSPRHGDGGHSAARESGEEQCLAVEYADAAPAATARPAVQLNRTGRSLSCPDPSCILRRIPVAPPRSSSWTGPDGGTCSDGGQEEGALRLAFPR